MLGRKKIVDTPIDTYSGNLPEDTCIYAIGDIHGRFDLLIKLQALIEEDMHERKCARRVVVYLGDFVDRAAQSKDVIERLLTHSFEGAEHVYLMGNHEFAMLNFLSAPDLSDAWLAWGGDATLQSYDVELTDEKGERRPSKDLAHDLSNNIPDEHLDFLHHLKLYHQEGNFLFVHAGVRPGLPLTAQAPNDMLMIRDEFIFSKKMPNQIVVFGHTIFDKPFLGPMRIGVDTGAYYSDVLTCAVITSHSLDFIKT
ncbi:MAG: serine/threonine protein phosphatase [Proteobacteria bacterium]|nr:serine/threonine protein phosphatase [Pseudomonadota bacterium]